MDTLLVALLAAFCYVNTLSITEMIYDDYDAVVTNKDVRTETPIHSIFAHDFWGESMQSSKSHNSYRPLTILSFRLDYAIGGLQSCSSG